MIRLGIVDMDTSHCVEFTKRLNHKGISQDQWVDGAQVIGAVRMPSQVTETSKVDAYCKAWTEELGLPFFEKPEDLIGKIDAVMIEANDGSVHLERARPFLEAGIPAYIDKPFATSVSDAREIIALAERKKLPLFSASSLRFAPEVVKMASGGYETGAIHGCDVFCPASLHVRNPGLFHYGIHGVETLFTIMGPGCEKVWCASQQGADKVVGQWKDGRIGTVRGIREGASGYGVTAFGEKKVQQIGISTQYIYRELLKHVVAMFQTGKPPIPVSETLEIVGFIEAAYLSAKAGGELKLLVM